MGQLVSTNWLNNNKNKDNIVIFDASWQINDNISSIKSYKKEHIKGSYFFDIELISNLSSNLPHSIPSKEYFIKKIKKYNIHNNTKIIAYGNKDIVGASRAWWMFKYFGFNNIFVLNGGLKKWKLENKSLTDKKSVYANSTFVFNTNKEWLSKKNKISKIINTNKYLLIDGRNSERFMGKEPEPRLGLKSGHIPKSKNIFWKKFTKENHSIVSKKKIKELFSKYDIKNKKTIFTCGSGMTACVLSLSLMHGLDIKSSVYDGSWAEWGSNNHNEVK